MSEAPLFDFAKLNEGVDTSVSRYMRVYREIPAGYRVAGTGHRPERFRDTYLLAKAMPAIEVLKSVLLEIGQQRDEDIEEGGIDPEEKLLVISGMAPGFDQWLAAAALSLKKDGLPVELWCIIPWKGFEWPRYWQANRPWIKGMLEKAVKVSYLTDIEIRNNDRAAQAMMCHDRNEELAIFGQKNLSGWDRGENGGTWDTVKRMRKRGNEPLNVYDELMAALFPPPMIEAGGQEP